MNLIKNNWEKNDICEFRAYLKSLSKGTEKAKWESKIVNTSLPCLAVPSFEIKRIVSQISKGNFLSFLQYWPWQNHCETVIVGNLICNIKDFELFENYLTKFALSIDNWASCDSLKFKINNDNKNDYSKFANCLILNRKPFAKRVGLLIIFKLLNNKEYLKRIFHILNSFQNEKEYYVNMMLAWIICESFIKYKEETIAFLHNNCLNKFVVNKAISKCRDSFRVSKEDKDFLLKFKR